MSTKYKSCSKIIYCKGVEPKEGTIKETLNGEPMFSLSFTVLVRIHNLLSTYVREGTSCTINKIRVRFSLLNFRSALTIAQSFLPLFYSIININFALNISHECKTSTKIISNQIASILFFLSGKTTKNLERFFLFRT